MSQAKNKLTWCLKKAEKELKKEGKHRGLIIITPDKKKSFEHIKKAEHNLNAAIDFSKTGYSDWSASAFFYSIYQCFLAIGAKFGYESGNQECTFALITSLIEDKKIPLDQKFLNQVTSLEAQRPKQDSTSVKIREQYQYGTDLAIDEKLYNELLKLSQRILLETKV